MPYEEREAIKFGVDVLNPGSSGGVSASTAGAKAAVLNDILQKNFQTGNRTYDGTDIDDSQVIKAIMYVISKKKRKAVRKVALGGTKVGLSATSITLGSAGGLVTDLDYLKRGMKKSYKHCIVNTQGKHRKQAAIALLTRAWPEYDTEIGNPALEALVIILGREFHTVVNNCDVDRLADRMMSN